MSWKELLKPDFRTLLSLFFVIIVYEAYFGIISNKIYDIFLVFTYPGFSSIFVLVILAIIVIGVKSQVFIWSKIGKFIGYDFKLNSNRMIKNLIYIFVLTALFVIFLIMELINFIYGNYTSFKFEVVMNLSIKFLVFYFVSILIVWIYDKRKKK